MTDHDLYRATLPDGTELLLTVWADGTHEVATRTDRCWGPPVELVPVPNNMQTWGEIADIRVLSEGVTNDA